MNRPAEVAPVVDERVSDAAADVNGYVSHRHCGQSLGVLTVSFWGRLEEHLPVFVGGEDRKLDGWGGRSQRA